MERAAVERGGRGKVSAGAGSGVLCESQGAHGGGAQSRVAPGHGHGWLRSVLALAGGLGLAFAGTIDRKSVV